MKALADDKINMTETSKFVFGKGMKYCGKRENAFNVFKKTSSSS